MNKAELIVAVADKANVTKRDAEAIVDALIEEIEANLVAGEEVKISGFGIIQTKVHKARQGSNPTTHEPITIPESKAVSFKPSKALKEKLN